MNRINLLPWREELRKARQKNFLMSLLIALLATAAFMYGWRLLVTSQIDHQQARNSYLKSEIQKLDKQLKEIEALDRTKARILARMQVIQDLQARRPEAVHLMDEMVAVMPAGVYLTSLSQAGYRIELQGKAQSNAQVSALMRNTEGSEWLTAPQLQIVENKSEDKAAGESEFRLVVNQRREDEEKAQAEEATE
jgi:type IV pilus assembly protein PilN